MPVRMSRRKFEDVALQALRELPAEFLPYVADCGLVVEKRASRELLNEMGVPEGEDIYGYCQGEVQVDRTVDDLPSRPPRIVLYSEPLMEDCDSEEELVHEIQTTVLHEAGHFFCLDEARLEELGFE